MFPRVRLTSFGAVLLLLIPAAASAAPVSMGSQTEVAVLSPLTVLKRADLDFGTLVVSGAGIAIVDPVGGGLTTTGAVVKAGTAAHPARFTSTGSKNAVVQIRLPKNPITLTRAGGTETVTVSTWTQDGATTRHIPANETFDFYVGATVTVAATQAPGTYNGTFDVTVQYP